MRTWYIWIIAAAVFLVDRVTKLWVINGFELHDSRTVLNGLLSLTYVQNNGAAFGLFSGQVPIFVGLTIIGLAAVFFLRKTIARMNKFMFVCIGLIVGGALGNLADRVYWGYVVDFIDFHLWPFIFNIADSALVIGSIMLAVMVFLYDRKSEEEIISGTPAEEFLLKEQNSSLSEKPVIDEP